MTHTPALSCLVDWPKRAEKEQAQSQPYLGVSSVEIQVRDQEKSLQFYVEKLGFQSLIDVRMDTGIRCIAVAPPNYSAILALIRASNNTNESSKIGCATGVTLVTDNIAAKFDEWSDGGVRFSQPPTPVPWGSHAIFEDLDGNQFSLLQSPRLVDLLSAQRRAVEEREQAERRAAYEMEVAKRVQAQLFPHTLPPLETLEYAGACLQARHVGGDYYDFLDLGPGRLAMVVGDIAGKGIAGALLMANLQAQLRGQKQLALHDLPRMLESVSQSLHENTPAESYATLFFAQYQDETRRLRYVNCGHLPALLLRQNGTVELLNSNATVLGMFRHWECTAAEVTLNPGDTLLLYTDGVTETINEDGRESGEDALIEILRSENHLPAEQLLTRILTHIREFSARAQEDDITLVIARCHRAAG